MNWENVRKKRDANYIHPHARPSFYLTDKYIINKLFNEGILREVSVANPDLIEAERLKIKIKRLIKQKQNGKRK